MPKPEGLLTILQGDWIEQLRQIPDESVQMCVTSPPYFGLRDYGVNGQLGLEKTPDEYVSKLVAGFREMRRVLKDDGSFWLNLGDSYAASGRGGGGGSFNDGDVGSKVSASNNRRAPVVGLKQKDLIGVPWMAAFALRKDGWYLRSDIIWSKSSCLPESVEDRPTKSHEYIFLLSKSPKYYYDFEAIKEKCSKSFMNDARWKTGPTAENEKNGYEKAKAQNPKSIHRLFKKANTNRNDLGEASLGGGQSLMTRNKRSVWTVCPASYGGAHFATFPTKLIEPCILAGSKAGDVVLDPFAGSGTTGEVALTLGRKAVLVELNPDYIKMIEKRCTIQPGFPFAA